MVRLHATSTEKEEAVRLYLTGLPIAAVGERVGRHKSTVSVWVAARGIRLRGRDPSKRRPEYIPTRRRIRAEALRLRREAAVAAKRD